MITWNRNNTAVDAKRPDWLPIVAQARDRQSTRGLPTPPPGLPRRNGYYTSTRSVRKDGTVRVFVKWCCPGWQTTTLGSYLAPAGSRVPVGRIITRSDGLRVQIMEDQSGLPWPVLVLDT